MASCVLLVTPLIAIWVHDVDAKFPDLLSLGFCGSGFAMYTMSEGGSHGRKVSGDKKSIRTHRTRRTR